MKFLKKIPVLLVIFSLFTISSCQRDVDLFVPDNNNIGQTLNPSPVQASVTGKVIDQNDADVVGATVTCGTHSTTTDSRGLFRFSNIEMDKYASVVTVVFNGYFKGIRTFSAAEGSSGFVKIRLIQKSLAGTINAASGGAVTLSNNSIITLQPNSVVIKSTGQSYSGSINIYAANIDPTQNNISETVPGSFQAIDTNNFRVLLKSYGMLAVQLEGQSGELLQVETGKTATLRFTIPASLSSAAPASIPLWSLNETDGLWRQEGTATKTGNYYEGNVAHFSFWNCDAGSNTIFLELVANTSEGPLPNALVKITRINNGGYSYGYTDSTGHVAGLVFSNEPMLLEILSNCNETIYSQNIGPYTQNTNLGSITIAVPAQYTLTISGNTVDCSSIPVANGNAFIFWEGQLITIPINNGAFSTTITRCAASAEPVEIIVADNTTQQQSITWTGTATTGDVNTGTVSACGVSAEEYINYTVNSVPFSFNSSNNDDTLVQYVNQPITGTLIRGYRQTPLANFVNINMNYVGVGLGSSQQLTNFSTHDIENGDTTQIVNPIFVNITEFGSVGQFIAGEFSGSVMGIHPPYQVYDITCQFRLRRAY